MALREFLAAAVRARKNFIVCGGVDAGKTTLLRAMLNEVGPEERIVTIEDNLELGLDRYPDLHPDVVALEAREENVEGEGAIDLATLVRWGLRMNPDRVIVGEVRGHEVIPMLNAMSQGNDGSMCTIHANSSLSAFSKLAMYAVQAPERLNLEATNLMVANAINFVVHIGTAAGGGEGGMRRYVSSVREIVGAEGPLVMSNEIFMPGYDRRAVPGAPAAGQHAHRPRRPWGSTPACCSAPTAGGTDPRSGMDRVPAFLDALRGSLVPGCDRDIVRAAFAVGRDRLRAVPAGETGGGPARSTPSGVPFEASVTGGAGRSAAVLRYVTEPGAGLPFFGPRLAAQRGAVADLAARLAPGPAPAARSCGPSWTCCSPTPARCRPAPASPASSAWSTRRSTRLTWRGSRCTATCGRSIRPAPSPACAAGGPGSASSTT